MLMQINHDIQAFWRDIWNPGIFHWLFLFFQMKEDVSSASTDSQIETSSNENTKKGQISGWTDRYPYLQGRGNDFYQGGVQY